MSETRETVVRLVAEATGRDPAELGDETRLAEDLRLKSANRIELGVLMSEALDVEIPVFDVLRARTVGDLVTRVEGRRAATPA